MNTPGFTAEASLERTATFYGMINPAKATFTGKAVTPALPIIDSIFRGARCVAACTLCVLAGGVGSSCWVCRNCIIIATSVQAKM